MPYQKFTTRGLWLTAFLYMATLAQGGCIQTPPEGPADPPANNTQTGNHDTTPDMKSPDVDMAMDVIMTDEDMKPLDLCADVVCEAASACQRPGTCDPLTGECTYEQMDDGAACDDGLICTTDDRCNAGVCTGTHDPITFADAGATTFAASTRGGELGQSFTTGDTGGSVATVHLWRNGHDADAPASSITIKFYDGESRTGLPLYSRELLLPQSLRASVEIPDGPRLEPNTQYSLIVVGPSDTDSWIPLHTSEDTHPGGRLFHDEFHPSKTTDENIDLRFEIDLQTVCP